MQSSDKIRALRHALGHESYARGDELVFRCPRGCRPDKAKLSVNIKTDRFHCWICDFGGDNLIPLLKRAGDTELLQQYAAERLHQPIKDIREYETPKLPREFISLSRPLRSPYAAMAMRYVTDRGLTRADVLRLKLGYCEDGPYKYRVVFPSFDTNGELNFVVGRAFVEHLQPYKMGNYSKDIIFNEYMIDWKEPVVVTEGPFDAAVAGENAIPLLGCSLNETSDLFRKIVMKSTDVYFAMDTDAYRKQLHMMEKLLGYGVTPKCIPLKGAKDVGSLSRERFNELKSEAVVVRSSLDLLRLRVSA